MQLSSDRAFHFEILRQLATAVYQGSDVNEILVAADAIKPGDFESFYRTFNDLAERVHRQAQQIDAKKHPVSVRSLLFKASTYYRAADFYVHGKWDDPRINSLWDKQRTTFDTAIALLPVPAQRVNIPAAKEDGFTVPGIFYGCGKPGSRPTLLTFSGFDGSQEELFHFVVDPALQRGMHVLTIEGPGQPTVRREQGVPFIFEWEKVVTPAVDYLLTRSDVDAHAIGMVGISMGGYLGARAVAFEHRLAAFLAIDGMDDMGAIVMMHLPEDATAAFKAGKADAFNDIMNRVIADPSTPTVTRWMMEHGMWAWKLKTPFEFITAIQPYKMGQLYSKIKTPVLVGDAENDLFAKTQPKHVAKSLGNLATYQLFKTEDGVGEHCSLGGMVLSNQISLDWFEDLVAQKKNSS